ncbi:MAG: serine/threonine protein kinase [Deltaproteobacteria bacterium]|nr:serine/threonine protein kinase [Deltaproteobacteria bacterium]MBW2533142.1 serine/threonine protein kinase [Deltaproteobacteria bacterium]
MGELRGTVAGRFQIDRLAGSGGMGAVYRAWDAHTGSIVALKVLHAQTTITAYRFGRESDLLAELGHPNIVRYVAHGVTDLDEPYLAMEWLEGEDLADLLQRRVLTTDETVRLGALVADALGAAHALGIVHRDLKPPNIFLVDGQVDRVKVVDFGIARDTSQAGERLTRTGMLLGTPAYMAPEQIRAAKAVGPAADVWALGAVLFQCLTGRYLFHGTTPMEMAVAALGDEPPTLSSALPDAPSALEAVIANFLSREPEYRPADGAAAAALLRKLGAGDAPRPAPVAPAPAVPAARCMVLVRPPEVDDPSAPLVEQVRALVEQHGAELLLLPDGTAAAVVTRTLSLEEQVATAAQAALALRAVAPNAAMVLVADQTSGGKTQVAARSGAQLFERATSPDILLDDLAAEHVRPPFGVSWAGDLASLTHAEAPAAYAETQFAQTTAEGPSRFSAPPRSSSPGRYVAFGAAAALLLLLVLGAAGWGYLAWTGSEGDDVGADESEDDSSCPADHCLPFRPSSSSRFDPGASAAAVVEAVHGIHRSAQLTMIMADELSGGTADLQDESVQYVFHLPKAREDPALYVYVQKRRLKLTRTTVTTPAGQQPIPPPKCTLARAWAVARKHGLGKSEPVSAVYSRANHPMTGAKLGPVWQLTAEGETSELWYVDGASCVGVTHFNPGSLLPGMP